MSTFWTDLLFLHGYITDANLARRWANNRQAPSADNSHEAHRTKTTATTSMRWYARLCLGIGDGVVHTQ